MVKDEITKVFIRQIPACKILAREIPAKHETV